MASGPMSAAPVPEKGLHPSPETRHSCAHPGKRAWARLIKKVYEVDPLLCTRCSRPLKIVSLINTPSVIETILRHHKL